MSNWKCIRFADLFDRVERKFLLEEAEQYKCVGVRWYGMGAFVREKLIGAEISRKQQWIVQAGDVVYNKLFAWKGAFAVADTSVDGCIVSDKFPTYQANSELVDLHWLEYYFRMPLIAQQAESLSKGAAAISKLTLNPPQFWELSIPLPPLAEQRRMLERIDELATQIDEARTLRRAATEEAEALIHSLTSKLAYQDKWEMKRLPEVAQVNPSRVGNVKLKPSDKVSFVPMKAVDDVAGKIAWPETREFQEVAKGYTWFADGDVIFARITPCMQNGKSAYAQNLVNGVGFGSTEFHVIRPGNDVCGGWIYYLVRHKAFRDDAAEHFKGTAGQQRVPRSFLEEKLIPVPPLPEQRRIVAELDALQADVAALKRLQAETAAELDALLPSILDKAFKGEL